MKFIGPDNQIVWDGERGKALCRFKEGALETDDERTISMLQSLGYESEGEPKKKAESSEEQQESEPEKSKRGRPKKE